MKNYKINIDWIILLLLIFFSCKKEEDPIPQAEVLINGSTTDMAYGNILQMGGDNIFRISSENAENFFEFNFGDQIGSSYQIEASPLPGFQDTVRTQWTGTKYYVYESTEPFYFNISESGGYYSGSFSGNLHNEFIGTIIVSGTFKNID